MINLTQLWKVRFQKKFYWMDFDGTCPVRLFFKICIGASVYVAYYWVLEENFTTKAFN